MAEFPALPLFTDAYLADTRHLTTIQNGAYLLLLMMAWRSPNCALPDNDDILAKWTGMDRRTWLRNKRTVLSFWVMSEHGWQQKRLLDERAYVGRRRSINVAAGRASALKRLNRGSTDVEPNANETSTPTPTPTPNKKEREQDSITASAVTTTYAFESGIIRLTQKNLDQWIAAFSELDVPAELIGLTPWADQQGSRWFPAVSGALTKRNREIKTGRKQESFDDRRPHPHQPKNGFAAALDELKRSIAEDEAGTEERGETGGRPPLRLLPNGRRS